MKTEHVSGLFGRVLIFGKGIFHSDSIRGNAVKIYLLQFLGMGMMLFSSVVTARTMGPSLKGMVDLFTLLQSFIVDLGLLGFGSGLLYSLANQGKPLAVVHGTGMGGALFFGLVTAGIGFGGLKFWHAAFPQLPVWILLMAFCLSPVAYYSVIWSNIQNGINKPVTIQNMSLIFSVISLAAVLTLWQMDLLDPLHMILNLAALSILNGAASFSILFTKEKRLRFDPALAVSSFRRGLFVYFGFVANIIHFKVDQVFINFLYGTREVGLYALSVRYAEMLFVLDSALISSALYKISSAPRSESHALTGRVFRKQLLISGVSGLGFMLIAYPLVHVLYGAAFSESVRPLILLIPGVVCWSVAKVLSQFIAFNAGRFGLGTTFALIGLAVNVGLNLILIPKMGISGAALASSLSYGSVFVLTFVAYKRLA